MLVRCYILRYKTPSSREWYTHSQLLHCRRVIFSRVPIHPFVLLLVLLPFCFRDALWRQLATHVLLHVRPRSTSPRIITFAIPPPLPPSLVRSTSVSLSVPFSLARLTVPRGALYHESSVSFTRVSRTQLIIRTLLFSQKSSTNPNHRCSDTEYGINFPYRCPLESKRPRMSM